MSEGRPPEILMLVLCRERAVARGDGRVDPRSALGPAGIEGFGELGIGSAGGGSTVGSVGVTAHFDTAGTVRVSILWGDPDGQGGGGWRAV